MGGAAWVCHGGPLGKKTVIYQNPFWKTEIENHQASCHWCLKNAREAKANYKLYVDGRLKMMAVLDKINEA